jgi:hypothetical protein
MQRREIVIGALVQMRKPHPCGGDQWLVYRVGADIGIRCTTCHRQVMLARGEFFKRLKTVIDAPNAAVPLATSDQGAGES